MADHGIDLDAVRARLKGHSIFAPSASATWLNCSGALIPNLLAEDDAGEDAAYGTVGHGVGELWLKSGQKPTHLLGRVEQVDEGHAVFNITIDAEMMNYVEMYVNWCAQLPGDHYVEQRVDFSRLTPIEGQGGTADHIACQPGVLTITDLKLGKGYQVFAKRNTQGMLYALGSYFKWDPLYKFERVIIRICQPRLGHFDEWEISVQELLEFADYVIERAAMAWDPNAVRTAGILQCQWCKVRATCAERARWIYEIVDGCFDDLAELINLADFMSTIDDDDFSVQLVPARELSHAQMVKLIRYRKSIENWLKDIEDALERKMLSGQEVPGKKLVAGRSKRVFRERNPQRLADTLEMISGVPAEKFLETSVYGITEIEKIFQNEGGYRPKDIPGMLEGFVLKMPGKPVMADDFDKRPAVTLEDGDVFEAIDDGDGTFEVVSLDDDL